MYFRWRIFGPQISATKNTLNFKFLLNVGNFIQMYIDSQLHKLHIYNLLELYYIESKLIKYHSMTLNNSMFPRQILATICNLVRPALTGAGFLKIEK